VLGGLIMTITGAPDLAALSAWLGLEPGDDQDSVVLQESLDAALAQQCLVVVYPCDSFGDRVFNDDLREAVYLRSQRLAARRNSPEGIVGLSGVGGEFVGARVPAYDSDVAALEAPHRVIAVS
jgi:hypothetical protein